MSKLVKRDIIENFGGGAKSDVAGIYLPSGFVPESLNVDFSIKEGAARKRKGYTRLNTVLTGTPTITGIYEAKLGGITTRLVTALRASSSHYVYEWDGSSGLTNETEFSGGSFTSDSYIQNRITDFTVTNTATDGFVVVFVDGVAVRKWDGYTHSILDVTGANGGGDLGIDYFRPRFVTSFRNRTLFANTSEGNSALASDWTADDPVQYTHKHNDSTVLEIQDIYNSGDGGYMTRNEGNYATLAVNEWDVFEKELYVRRTANAAPAATVIPIYRAHERIRWTKLTSSPDPGGAEDHDPLNLLDVVTQPGKEIVRILPLRDLLMVYKEDSIWALYQTGDAESPFAAYCVDHNTPCVAGFSVVDIKGEHFFLSEEGMMKTNGAKVDPVLVSTDVPQWFENINRDDYQYSYGAVNQYLKQARWLIPNQGGAADITDKDREIRFDYQSGVWSEHKYAGNANVIASVVNSWAGTWDAQTQTWDQESRTWDDPTWSSGKTTRFYTGDYAGFVREHDAVEYDDEGATNAIEAYIITKPLNLSQEADDIDKTKRLLNVRMRLDTGTGISLDVYKKLDNLTGWVSVGAIDCDQTGSIFEGKINLNGTCKECQYKLGNNAATQPFCIYWLLTEYLLRSEK